MRPTRIPVVIGEARFTSALFSNRWRLQQHDDQIAELFRIPSRHTSRLVLPGATIDIEPLGWGTMVAMSDGEEIGRIVRRSWWGRRWDVSSPGVYYELVSDRLPRRWSFRVGHEPVTHFAGGFISYNVLRVSSIMAVPVVSLALAWHVIARPWEAAATPGALVPTRAPQPRTPYA